MPFAPLAVLIPIILAQAPAGATPAWTVRLSGDIRWQQVTPAGALLVSTDGALAGVDIERGQIAWQKPELGGLPVDSIRIVEGSLLMEAAKPGLSLIFDPVTGTVLFDSRHLSLTRVVTRRVLPQTGTLLVHGRRASGPPLVALYDLATGAQRWVSESLFQQSGPKRGGLGGLMQGLVRVASEGTQLEVLQAGPEVIVVNTLTSLRGLDARTGATRWSATLPTARAGNPAKHVRLFPSIDKPDRIYVGFDDRLMAYKLADGQPLWAYSGGISLYDRTGARIGKPYAWVPAAPRAIAFGRNADGSINRRIFVLANTNLGRIPTPENGTIFELHSSDPPPPPPVVTVEDAVAELLDPGRLSAQQLEMLDQRGNKNGRYDVGDLRAFLVANGVLPAARALRQ